MKDQEFQFSKAQWAVLWLLPLCVVLMMLIFGGWSVVASYKDRQAQAQPNQNLVALQERIATWNAIEFGKAKSTTYNVSGAGKTEWNGNYRDNGTINGQTAYKLDDEHWLLWSNTAGSWVLIGSALAMPKTEAYIGGSDPHTPVSTGVWRTPKIACLQLSRLWTDFKSET